MAIDENTDLLGRRPIVGALCPHTIPFTTFKTVLVKKPETLAIMTEQLENYKSREFVVTPDNYGLEVSVNYKDGLFVSMILKGDGVVGEVIEPNVATMVMPPIAKNKGQITLHAMLSVQDTREFRFGLTKYDIEKFIKHRLLGGFDRYEDKKIVCRPLKLFVDGIQKDTYDTWECIDNLTIPGLQQTYTYQEIFEDLDILFTIDRHYLLPQKGLIIEDAEPSAEGAFPETHYLFDTEGVINND